MSYPSPSPHLCSRPWGECGQQSLCNTENPPWRERAPTVPVLLLAYHLTRKETNAQQCRGLAKIEFGAGHCGSVAHAFPNYVLWNGL